jgi:hypothetical protein
LLLHKRAAYRKKRRLPSAKKKLFRSGRNGKSSGNKGG